MEPFAIPTFGGESAGTDIFKPEEDQIQAAMVALGLVPPLAKEILSPTQRDTLAREIDEMLSGYGESMKDRWERDKLIEDCYNLRPEKKWAGQYPGAAEMVSEMLMASVDQAQARLAGNILGTTPILRVKGVESGVVDVPDAADVALIIEPLLENYLRQEIRIDRELPIALYGTAKFGSSIIRLSWDDDERVVDWKQIANQDVVVWPSWNHDWSEAEWAGHRTFFTVAQFRALAISLDLDPKTIDEIAKKEDSGSRSDGVKTFGDLESAGIEAESVTTLRGYGVIEIYELWGNRVLPEEDQARRIQLFYHPESRKILWAGENTKQNGRHPYFPIRYKVTGTTAWAQGVGHEVLMCQASDTAYRNLELDNLMASCFGVNVVRMNSTADQLFDKVYPGMKVPTEDPEGDFKWVSLADSGPLSMLQFARSANEQRKISATGQAAVLEGQGDPTLKSGGGTGAIMALIQEASKKFGGIDRTIRQDLVEIGEEILNLLAQYGDIPELLKNAPPEDAGVVQAFFERYAPEGLMQDILNVTVEAPSASYNEQFQKQELQVLYNMLIQHGGMMVQQYAPQILMATNPAEIPAYMYKWSEFLRELGERLVTLHQVPALKGKIPTMQIQPSMEQMQINNLMQQLQLMQQQVQELMSGGAPLQASPDGVGASPEGQAGGAPPGAV